MDAAARALREYAPDMELRIEQAAVELADGFTLREISARGRTSDKAVELELNALRAVADDDAETLFQIFVDNDFLTDPSRFEPERLLAQLRDSSAWYMSDEDVQLTPELASAIAIETSDPRSSYFDQMRHQRLPSEHVFARPQRARQFLLLPVQLDEQLGFLRQDPGIHGLEQHVDGGRFEAAEYRRRVAGTGRCHEHDRRGTGPLRAAHHLGELVPIQRGYLHVDEHERKVVFAREVHGLRRGGGSEDFAIGGPQREFERLERGLVLLDDQAFDAIRWVDHCWFTPIGIMAGF